MEVARTSVAAQSHGELLLSDEQSVHAPDEA